MGETCIGFGCSLVKSKPNEDEFSGVFGLKNRTTFDRNIKPAIDNVAGRYKVNQNDPKIDAMVQTFFGPARRVLGEYFLFEPLINYKIFPEKSSIEYSVDQKAWGLFEADGSPASKRILGLVGNVTSPLKIVRCKVEVTGFAFLSNESTSTFDTKIKLIIETLSPGKAFKLEPVRQDRLEIFANEMSARLRADYRRFFFSEYGMSIIAAS